jgi:hypothetical protein
MFADSSGNDAKIEYRMPQCETGSSAVRLLNPVADWIKPNA